VATISVPVQPTAGSSVVTAAPPRPQTGPPRQS
jgi:hypothetical protein